jgi:AraC-like DNA-binding protein
MGVSVRHQRACQMLAETRQPIGQIAQRLGYGSVMAFSHAFKQQAAVSPRAWRASRTV